MTPTNNSMMSTRLMPATRRAVLLAIMAAMLAFAALASVSMVGAFADSSPVNADVKQPDDQVMVKARVDTKQLT